MRGATGRVKNDILGEHWGLAVGGLEGYFQPHFHVPWLLAWGLPFLPCRLPRREKIASHGILDAGDAEEGPRGGALPALLGKHLCVRTCIGLYEKRDNLT